MEEGQFSETRGEARDAPPKPWAFFGQRDVTEGLATER